MNDFALLGLCIVVSVGAQVLLKLGVQSLGGVHVKGLEEAFRTFTNPLIVAGFGTYFLGSYLWLSVLSRFPFSKANLYFSTNHLLTLAIAVFYFGDKLSPVNLLGALMMIAGLYLVSLH